MPELVFVTSGAAMACGVEMFARRLFEAWRDIGGRAQLRSLPSIGWSSSRLGRGDVVVLNFPLVGWKKAVLLPLFLMACAKLSGKKTLLILHEWEDLAWQRRVAIAVYLLLADTVMFSSPTVAEQFSRRLLKLRRHHLAGILPIPPNLARPFVVRPTGISQAIAARAQGRMIIGQFGSIYPKKNSMLLLEVACELKRRGMRPLVVFAGSFIKGSDHLEVEFDRRIDKLGLKEDVIVTGYIETAEEIFSVVEQMDVVLYNFKEGLTSRRSSVLATLQSSTPLIVNSPSRSDEFDHHKVFQRAIVKGALRFVPEEATIADYADAVESAGNTTGRDPDFFFRFAWQEAARALSLGVRHIPAHDRSSKEANGLYTGKRPAIDSASISRCSAA